MSLGAWDEVYLIYVFVCVTGLFLRVTGLYKLHVAGGVGRGSGVAGDDPAVPVGAQRESSTEGLLHTRRHQLHQVRTPTGITFQYL